MAAPRVFVSHSHQDDQFTSSFVADLRSAGADVWVDITGIEHGDFVERINDALASRDWLILVLTENAIQSQYVRMEVNAAITRKNQGLMIDVVPILAAPCDVRAIPPLWSTLHRYDATRDYPIALQGVLRTLGLAVLPPPPRSGASNSTADYELSGVSTPRMPSSVTPIVAGKAPILTPAAHIGERETQAGYAKSPDKPVLRGTTLPGNAPQATPHPHTRAQPARHQSKSSTLLALRLRTAAPTALKNSAPLGCILGLGHMAAFWLDTNLPTSAALTVVGILVFVGIPTLISASGVMSARRTGTVLSGAIAGFFTCWIWLTFVWFYVAISIAISPSKPSDPSAILEFIVLVVFSAFPSAILGAGLGALGGRIGRASARKRHVLVQPL